jgi:hypothetical protein
MGGDSPGLGMEPVDIYLIKEEKIISSLIRFEIAYNHNDKRRRKL